MRLSSPPLVLAFVVSGVVSSVASAFTPASTFLVSTVHHRSSHSSSSSSSSSSSNLFMKTIAVFGASGLTSREVIYQALESGDRVVGLTRNPSNVKIPEGSGGESKSDLPIVNDDMTIVGGDVTKMSDVNAAFDAAGSDGVDGVVIALGGKTKDVGNTMLTDGTENVMAVMKERGIKRLAVVTSIGAGDSKDQAPFAFKILMMTVMKKIFEDKNAQEEAVRASGLDYVIVRPGGLTVKPPTGEINVIEGEAGSISRADVATFCLDAVTVDDFPWVGQTPCISSVGGTSWTKDRSKTARGEM